MIKKAIYISEKIFQFGILAICALLPFQPNFLATIEIITVIFFFLSYSPKTIFLHLKDKKIFIPFLFLFLFTACSYFFSEDKQEAGRQIEVKLAFLVIPLLLLGSGMDKSLAKIGLTAFLSGCALACMVLLSWSCIEYFQTGSADVFIYSSFSKFMHVSYFSMYLIFCFGWFFMLAMEDKLLFPKTHYFLMVLFALCIFLISSKITLATFMLSSLLFAGYYVYKRNRILPGILIVLTIILFPVAFYYTSPNIKLRVDDFVSEIAGRNKPILEQNMGSTATRMFIWKDALPQIKEHILFGVAPGDVQQMLLDNYEKRQMWVAWERKYNLHNEYLQQLAGLGIAGFLLFLAIILLPAFVCQPPYRFIGWLFSFTIAIVSLTESILERQAGTIFICLVGILLMITYGKEKKSFTNS